MLSDRDFERVEELVRETAARELVPRFGQLARHEVREKRPGDYVTVADEAAELRLAAGLARILPGVPVVGEEAVAQDRGLVDRLHDSDAAWLVDPLDGTSNFAASRDRYAVIVALVRAGRTAGAWILDVSGDRMAVAQAGAGARLDGAAVALPRGVALAQMGGYVGYKIARRLREAAAPGALERIGWLGSLGCAGIEYVDVLAGRRHFSLYRWTNPWDHAAGALLMEEAGGVARRWDGAPYRPTQALDAGIVTAPDAASWSAIHGLLLGDPLPLFGAPEPAP